MELKRIDVFLLKALLLMEAGIIICQVLALDRITSLLFTVTFPLTVLLWIRSVRQRFTETDAIMLTTAVLATVGVLVNAAQNNATFGFEYLKKLIMFIMALLFFQTAYRVRIDKEVCTFIGKIIDFLVLFLIAMYFLLGRQMHTLNGRYTIYLTFRFTNPNMTAMFLVSLYMLKLRRIFVPGKWYVKLFHIVQLLLLAWFTMQTQSRNCLLVLAVYTVLTSWLTFRGHDNFRIKKGTAALFAVFPGMMVAVYMLIINTNWVQSIFSFLVAEGKKLNSRVAIWLRTLKILKNSPVFGAYYEISNGTGMSQMHNTHLDIAASYGVLVLVLTCILLSKYLYQRGRIYNSKGAFVYILAFACIILMGMGEAAVFSGGLGLYILAGIMLMLANEEVVFDGSRKEN